MVKHRDNFVPKVLTIFCRLNIPMYYLVLMRYFVNTEHIFNLISPHGSRHGEFIATKPAYAGRMYSV